MSDAIVMVPDAIIDVARPRKLKAIRSLIVNQERINRGQRRTEQRRRFCRSGVHRGIQEEPSVVLIGKNLYLYTRRQLA